jgi:predicted DNA-binding protein
MAQHHRQETAREPESSDKVVQQISVGFLPPIAELINIVAHRRGTTTSRLIGETVELLVVAAEKNPDVIGQEVRSYSHRLPEILAGDRSVDDVSPAPRHGPRPQYTKRLSGYVTEDVHRRLDDLCARVSMGRARMVRLAVDKYLFEEIVSSRVGRVSADSMVGTSG